MAKTYAEMEPANAAAVLTELKDRDIELVLDIISLMKADESAEIMENMDPELAAELSRSSPTGTLKRMTENYYKCFEKYNMKSVLLNRSSSGINRC